MIILLFNIYFDYLLLSVLFFSYLKTKTFGGGGGGARSHLNMGAVSHRNREVLQKEKPSKSESKQEGVYRELVSTTVGTEANVLRFEYRQSFFECFFFASLLCKLHFLLWMGSYNHYLFYHENL